MDAQNLAILGFACWAFAIVTFVTQNILGMIRGVLVVGGAVAILGAIAMVVAG